MIKVLAIVAFLAIRYLISANNKKKQEGYTATTSSPKKKNRGLDDVLGDFMKNLEQKQNKSQPVLVNSDNHKAEQDTHKKVDWQDVETTHILEKKQLLKHSDYSNISHRNENVIDLKDVYDIEEEEVYDIEKEEEVFVNEFEDIDLRKAVIYKEILERKYFTI